jgi:hypothetical protein
MGARCIKLFPIVYFFWFLINGSGATVSVSINTPPAGRIIAGSVLVSATASADVVGVQFKLDGQNLGSEITNSPFSVLWNTTSASNGPHTLAAVARDAERNQATATITISVDNTLPVPPPSTALSVSIGIPPAGRILAGSVLVSASASPGVTGVQFKVDGQNLGSEVTSAPFSMIWNTTSASNGSHALMAVARDAAGSQAISGETVMVDNSLGFLPPAAPPLIYNFSGNGAKSWMSGNPSGELRVGHTRIHADPTSITPFGVAIIEFRQNDVFVTEAGIPATLPTRNGRCFVEANGTVNTGLAIANPNDQDATVSFYFTDRFGSTFGGGTITVSANHQLTGFVNQSPFNLSSNSAATFTFTSTVPIAFAALRFFSNERNDFLMSGSPFADLDIPNTADQVVVPHFAAGGRWRSQIVLVNPANVAISGDVQVFGQGRVGTAASPAIVSVDGVLNSTFRYSIAPHSFQRMVMDDATVSTQVGSIHIVPAGSDVAPSAFATLSFMNGGTTVSEASMAALHPALTFRTYVQSSGILGQVGSVDSGLAVANPSSAAVDTTLELIRLDGTSTGLSTIITIPEGGQIARFIHEIFPQVGSSFEGVLRLKSASPVTVAALRVRINERGDFIFTNTPPADEDTFTNPEVSFPIAVSGGGFSTQFVLLSISPGPTVSGSIWMLSSAGTPLDGTRQD